LRFRAVVMSVMASTVLVLGLAPASESARAGSAQGANVARAHAAQGKPKHKRRAKRHKAKKPPAKPPASPPGSVVIEGYAFHPDVLTIKLGTPVTWLFRDHGIAHWVVSDSEAVNFQSSPQSSGSLTFTFSQAGTYNYSCALHPWMKGEVVVNAASG
jgi:plastocyanin